MKSFVEPQDGQPAGAGITMNSRSRCSGNGLRDERATRAAHPGCGFFGQKLIFPRSCVQFIELKL